MFSPKTYINKMNDIYYNLFGYKPNQNILSPLEKEDYTEIDTSDLLDEKGIQIYQSLIGTLQWAISLGILDIITAVMSLSSFRVSPRKVHLDRVKGFCGYLSNMKHATIRICTEEPDYSYLSDQEFDWEHSVYGNVKELLTRDSPKPLGRSVIIISYLDANLYHDLIIGRSVIVILHLFNKTPI